MPTSAADSPSDVAAELRDAPQLRGEIRDAGLMAELAARYNQLDKNAPGGAALPSSSAGRWPPHLNHAVYLFGVPYAADRLAPLVPEAFERRLGDVADREVKTVFGSKVCDNGARQLAFAKLVSFTLDRPDWIPRCSQACSRRQFQCIRAAGRQVYLFNGLRRRRRTSTGWACSPMSSAISGIDNLPADHNGGTLVPDRPVRRRHRLGRWCSPRARC
jgi:hypothetical protein